MPALAISSGWPRRAATASTAAVRAGTTLASAILIVLAVLRFGEPGMLAIFAGVLWWNHYQTSQAGQRGEQLTLALDNVEQSKLDPADKQLLTLAQGSAEGPKAVAQLMRAGVPIISTSPDSIDWLREAVGPDIDIMVDCHARPSPRMGLRFAKALEPYGLYFFEEPCWPESTDGLAEVLRILGSSFVQLLRALVPPAARLTTLIFAASK